jgi:hypothetical protein
MASLLIIKVWNMCIINLAREIKGYNTGPMQFLKSYDKFDTSLESNCNQFQITNHLKQARVHQIILVNSFNPLDPDHPGTS